MTDPIATADPVRAAVATCEKIDALNPDLHAFLPEHERRTRLTAQARELSIRWPAIALPAGALEGLPVAVQWSRRAVPTSASCTWQ